MKFIKGFLIFTLLAFIALAAGLGFLWVKYAANLDEIIQKTVATELKKNFDMDLSYASVELDWQSLWKFKPSLAVKDIEISHPKKSLLAEVAFDAKVQELIVDLSLKELMKKRIQVKELIVNNVSFDIYGEVKKSGAKPDLHISDMNSRLSDFEISEGRIEQANIEVDMVFFASGEANLTYKGKVGPIDFEMPEFDIKTIAAQLSAKDSKPGPAPEILNLPSEGDLLLDMLVKDIPKELRQEYAANLLLAPGANDRAKLKAHVKGDLLNDFSGSGIFELNNVRLGKSEKENVQVKTNIPVSLQANLVTKQSAQLQVKNASVDFVNAVAEKEKGKALLQFNASLKMNLKNAHVSLNTNGSLQNIDINRFMSSFSPEENKIYGTLDMPNYQMSLAGIDAKEHAKSLQGSGLIHVANGRIDVLDKILEMKEKFLSGKNYLSNELNKNKEKSQGTVEGATSQKQPVPEKLEEATGTNKIANFSTLSTSFTIINRKFQTADLKINTPVADINGSGSINFKDPKEQKVDYDMQIQVKDIKKVPLIPIKIKGTIEKPKIKLDSDELTDEAKGQIMNSVIDFGLMQLQKEIERKTR